MVQDLEQKLWSIASGIPFSSDYFLQASPIRKLKKENLFSKVFETYFLELGSGWGKWQSLWLFKDLTPVLY